MCVPRFPLRLKGFCNPHLLHGTTIDILCLSLKDLQMPQYKPGPENINKCKNVNKRLYCQAQVRSPKVQSPKVKTKGTWADTKITWATTTTPPHPITFKHEGVLW